MSEVFTGKDLYSQFNEIFTEASYLRTITLKENLSLDEIDDFFNRMTELCDKSITKTKEALKKYHKLLAAQKTKEIGR